MQHDDLYWMNYAYHEAVKACAIDEVPVGAVCVFENQIIAAAHNLCEQRQQATAHAEILALEEVSKQLGRWRLFGCTLYVTLEPCFMCAGAMVQSRIDRLVFGTLDPKGGAVRSLASCADDHRLNHQCVIEGPIDSERCGSILKRFFQAKRQKN